MIAAMGVAMVGSLFSSDAWNNITFTAGEVINPKKNIPMSLFLGTSIVTILYLLANIAYLTAMPLRGSESGTSVFEHGMQFAVSDRLGTATISGLFGAYASLIMAGFIVISTFGCNNGLILSGARVYYAMAEDGLFFKKINRLNAKGVPATGLVIQCIWACLLCLSGTYGQLLDYVVFAVLIFYVLTIAGIFILRKKKPDLERPYRAFGFPVIPVVYILLSQVSRWFVHREASELDLRGWVRNTEDGHVEVVASADRGGLGRAARKPAPRTAQAAAWTAW